MKIDTYGGIKTLLRAPFDVLGALKKTSNIIMLPARNGVRVYGRLFPFFRRFFKNRKLHYVVIGGWLSTFLNKYKRLAKALKKFDGIYVETNTMKRALEAQGFQNIYVMPNCKELDVLTEDELIYPSGEPYKLCTFSRVMKEKGIEDAVNAVKTVNESLGRMVYTLDIYGEVDANQTEWFDELQKNLPEYVRYCGVVDFDKSVDTLKNYFALLFPTHYFTEGIPGTIIDAYAAGVPVISARWESFEDIVDEGITGIGYEFGDFGEFKSLIEKAAIDPSGFLKMKQSALEEMKKFTPEEVSKVLIQRIF